MTNEKMHYLRDWFMSYNIKHKIHQPFNTNYDIIGHYMLMPYYEFETSSMECVMDDVKLGCGVILNGNKDVLIFEYFIPILEMYGIVIKRHHNDSLNDPNIFLSFELNGSNVGSYFEEAFRYFNMFLANVG